jgi:1,4-dihydroxy-2-naphthoate polyprenyltransferase
MIKIWLKQTRANFLVLAVVLVMIGASAARHDGSFNIILFLATLFGVVMAHTSVNLFNEYSDWRTGIDAKTVRTPFSGGSGNLQKGLLKPEQVHRAAWFTLMLAFFTGLGLAWVSGWQVLLLMAAGGAVTVFYTDYITKWMLGELSSGITLGSFVVIGAYFVQTGTITPGIIWASISPGLLTMLLLLLNEFPDADADQYGGRRHMVIVFGKRVSGVIYAVLLLIVFLTPVFGAVTGKMPGGILLCLLTLPLAVYTSYLVLRYGNETPKLIPALGMNVIVVLATDFLMSVGYFIS